MTYQLKPSQVYKSKDVVAVGLQSEGGGWEIMDFRPILQGDHFIDSSGHVCHLDKPSSEFLVRFVVKRKPRSIGKGFWE